MLNLTLRMKKQENFSFLDNLKGIIITFFSNKGPDDQGNHSFYDFLFFLNLIFDSEGAIMA